MTAAPQIGSGSFRCEAGNSNQMGSSLGEILRGSVHCSLLRRTLQNDNRPETFGKERTTMQNASRMLYVGIVRSVFSLLTGFLRLRKPVKTLELT